MERRQKLHEKLQTTTKLNKMTIKQGDQLVTLNLRQDICNPDIEISDKVLYMLEQFIEKQQSILLTSPATTNQTIATTTTTHTDSDTNANNTVNKLKRNTSQSVSPSPSKRVRFDLNPNYHEIQTDDCYNSNNNLDVNNFNEKLSKSTTSEEASHNQENSNEKQPSIVPFNERIDNYLTINGQQHIPNVNNNEPNQTQDSTNQSNSVSNTQTVINTTPTTTNSSENNKQTKTEDKLNRMKQKKTSESTDQEENHEPDEEQNQSYNCRLCRLKFTNQRGLHEHVARIHGGKGGSFNLSLFADQDDDDNDENDDDNDYSDDDESNDLFDFNKKSKSSKSSSPQSSSSSTKKQQIWNNQFKKKKLPNSNLPHPNVAIRVAKVAYYNSKIGQSNSNQSNTNAFKSTIFTSGGIRGNFFSQERLPLRSCKIKMKLTSPIDQADLNLDENDKFLSNINILDEYKSIDRNTAVTYQTTNLSNDREDEILTDQEARAFFKSLLVYLPLNTNTDVIRLDDLIKLSQESEEGLLNNKILTDSLKILHELIVDSKQFGVSLYDLKKAYSNRMGPEALKMNIIIVLLQLLIDNFLVLAVGVVKRVYVAHEFKQHWVIESCKNKKGRGFVSTENETLTSDESNETNKETDQIEINEPLNSTRRIDKKADETNESSDFNKQFKPVCLVPRPWRYIDGLLNRPVLKKMFETILIYLKSYPNATLDTIAEHFCPVLQPIMTLELLEMLEKCKCVGKIYLKKETICNLFSDFQNGSTCVRNEEDLDGDEITCYYCKPNSIFTIKKLFQ